MRTVTAASSAAPEPSSEPATEPTTTGSGPNSGSASAPDSGTGGGGDRGRNAPSGKRTVIKDEFLVEGKLEKPSAYYILRRSSLDYDWARLDAKFSPLVLESVQDPLF